MVLVKCCITVLLISSAWAVGEKTSENEIVGEVRSGDELVSAVAQNCLTGNEPVMTCLRQKVLSYVNGLLGIRGGFTGRGLSDDKMDAVIARRFERFFNTHEFHVQLPKFLFEEAILTFNPSKGLADFKVSFPEDKRSDDETVEEARGHLKKKLILPLLLLLKLKIKALTPILLVIVGIKAIKAFIMSKLSLLLVIGFVLHQLFKKGGMPMAMMPTPMATDPPPVYGPPQTPATYGPPAPTPETSYGPWDPSSSSNGNNNNGNGNENPYSRWDSHSLAYNAHKPENTKTTQQLQPGI